MWSLNNFTIKSQDNHHIIGRTSKPGRLTVAQDFSMSCQGTGIGLPAVTETGCEMHTCSPPLSQLHLQTHWLETFSVLLDTVHCSKHSPTLADLQWKTRISWNINFILHSLRHQATYKLSFFLKQLSRLCFPDFKPTLSDVRKTHARLCLEQLQTASRAGFQKGGRKMVTKKDGIKIVLWLYGKHQCFMHVMGKNPGGQMETWNRDAFVNPGECLPLKCSPTRCLSSFHAVGK